MIEEFYVNNYKCLVDVRLPLTPMHVIIGQNDSGKTSLLEAMLALSRSVNDSLHDAFPGEWRDRELVYAGAEKSVIQFEVRLANCGGPISSGLTYHLEIEFRDGGSCWRGDEWSNNAEHVPIPGPGQGWTGVARRVDQEPGALRNHLSSIAGQLSATSLYRFDPQLMAVPSAIDPRRKFRMDPDGFGLATLLDDILGFDAERSSPCAAISASSSPSSRASVSSLSMPSNGNSATKADINPIRRPERESSSRRLTAVRSAPSRLRTGQSCSWACSP